MIELKVANGNENLNEIHFLNYDRHDEKIIFDTIIERLSVVPEVSFDSTLELPYSIVKHCKLNGKPFDIILDDDYGVYIFSDDTGVLSDIRVLLSVAVR